MRISGEERSKADDFRTSPSEFVRGETAKLCLEQVSAKKATFDHFWEACGIRALCYCSDHNFARSPGTKMRISGEERSKADDFRSFSSEFVRGETAKLYLKQGQCKNVNKNRLILAFWR